MQNQHRKLKSQKTNPNGSRRKRPTDKRKQLPREEQLRFIEDCFNAALQDCYQNLDSYSCADFAKDKEVFHTRLIHEGIAFAARTLPILSDGMFHILEGRQANFAGFELHSAGRYPKFLQGLFAKALNDTGKEEERAYYIKAVYQISVMFKKIEGPFKKKALRKQFAQFKAVDMVLGEIDFGCDKTKVILDLSSELCGEFIKSITLSDKTAVPRPGPGATNHPVEKNMRYEPHVLFSSVDTVLPYQEWFYPTPWHACLQSRTFLELYKNPVKEPTSRFKYVPKVYGKARGICIEENEIQWLQQAVSRLLRSAIDKDPILSERIKLQDQSLNAALALEGSLTREMATIDMSEASDRIARELVRIHFQSNPDLCDALMALSTKWIEPPKEVGGDLMPTNKYAPMGSGLCFPVMSLVHYFLCQAIIQLTSIPEAAELSQKVYVYGDDIVLPSQCAQAVFDWLPEFGIKLNVTKSYVRSFFRESCGTHAYYGVDITPIFIRKFPAPSRVASMASLQATESQCFTKGYYVFADHLRRWIVKTWRIRKIFLPLGVNAPGFWRPESVLRYLHRFTAAFSRRWDDNYQCPSYLVTHYMNPAKDLVIGNEFHANMRWIALGTKDFGSRHVRDVAEEGLVLRRRWTPASPSQNVEIHQVGPLTRFSAGIRRYGGVIPSYFGEREKFPRKKTTNWKR